MFAASAAVLGLMARLYTDAERERSAGSALLSRSFG